MQEKESARKQEEKEFQEKVDAFAVCSSPILKSDSVQKNIANHQQKEVIHPLLMQKSKAKKPEKKKLQVLIKKRETEGTDESPSKRVKVTETTEEVQPTPVVESVSEDLTDLLGVYNDSDE